MRRLFEEATSPYVGLDVVANRRREDPDCNRGRIAFADSKEIGSVAWLATTRELLDQAYFAAESLWHQFGECVDIDLVRHHVGKTNHSAEPAIHFMTPQMVASRKRSRNGAPAGELVIFDEAHHISAPEYLGAVKHLSLNKHRGRTLGLSATPGRTDPIETEELVELFGGNLISSDILGKSPIKVLQRRGVLARLLFRSLDVSKVRGLGTESQPLDASTALLGVCTRLVAKLSSSAQSLVFCETLFHCSAIHSLLTSINVKSSIVSSYTPKDERVKILRAFDKGDLEVLLNVSLLATGYDCPAVKHVVIARKIDSAILFEQIVGRAARGPAVGGTPKGIIWDFFGSYDKHGLPKSYARYEEYDWE